MTETPAPPSPVPGMPPQAPVLLPPLEDAAARARRQGCLKWGLVGCAGASVAVIIGLLFLMSNAKKVMDFVFDQAGEQIVSACAPDVTPREKDEFRAALKAFSEKARSGGVTTEQVKSFRSRVSSAIADNRVTAEELRALTVFLKNPS